MKKQWFEIWAWNKNMDAPILVAKVKSEGLANIVTTKLADMYDAVGAKWVVDGMAKLAKENKIA